MDEAQRALHLAGQALLAVSRGMAAAPSPAVGQAAGAVAGMGSLLPFPPVPPPAPPPPQSPPPSPIADEVVEVPSSPEVYDVKKEEEVEEEVSGDTSAHGVIDAKLEPKEEDEYDEYDDTMPGSSSRPDPRPSRPSRRARSGPYAPSGRAPSATEGESRALCKALRHRLRLAPDGSASVRAVAAHLRVTETDVYRVAAASVERSGCPRFEVGAGRIRALRKISTLPVDPSWYDSPLSVLWAP